MPGIKIKRKNGDVTEYDYDTSESEFRFNRNSALDKAAVDELSVGDINPSTNATEGFTFGYDAVAQELLLTDDDGVELLRQPKAGSTQFLQGIDVAFPFTAPEDGLTNFVNANNTTATSSGTTVGYTFSIDNQTIAQVSADSDGSGGIGDGKFIVRQAGGTAGSDQLEISHSGPGGAEITTQNGTLSLSGEGSDPGMIISTQGNNSVSVNAELASSTDGDDNLGSNTNRWKNFYLSGYIGDSNDNELLSFTSNSSAAVNEVTIANAATGNAPTISATGSDADIDLALTPKGTGGVVIDNYKFSEDTSNNELVLTGPTGTELIRQPASGATEFLQGLDISYPIEMPADSVNPFVNANVTASAAAGTEVGYRFQVNTEEVFRVVGEVGGTQDILRRRIDITEGRLGRTRRSSRNNINSDFSTNRRTYFVGVDTSAGAFTVTLSSLDAEDGREIVVHDQAGNASANSVTVATEGSETISGSQYGGGLNSISLTTDFESVILRSDGSDWYVV